jgi:ribonucleotide monophosphatase NagD (HAD superfamily)
MTPDGLALDAGPFVAAIEYATGHEALVVGKPSEAFFELVLRDMGIDAGEAAMVGDDVETDVGGAIDAGLGGLLVRTGKYREEFVARSGIEPTETLDSITDLPGLLEDVAR